MSRVIEFLARFGNLLLFVLLEAIALFIIVNKNPKQNQVSQGFFLQVSGQVSQWNKNIHSYFNLSGENEKLMGENTKLHKEIEELRNEISGWKSMYPDSVRGFTDLPDSVLASSGYYFLPARVINNSISGKYNYLTLNKGSRQGVKMGMGILSPTGVGGTIIEVSKDYSLALSVLNIQFRLSCKLIRNQNIGILIWPGKNSEYAELQYIPQTSGLQKGDTIVTSGYGTIFPDGMMVGTISQFDSRNQDGFYYIQVHLSTDFNSLDNVYLVGQNDRIQIDSLQAIPKDK